MSPPPLSDDDVRWLMVRTAASLGRLWARVEKESSRPGRPFSHELAFRHIKFDDPWLDQMSPGISVSGIIQAIVLAENLLLHYATSREAPNRRKVCLLVQHVSCDAPDWSNHTLRIAGKLGVKLAATPREETNGSSLHTEIYELDGTYAEARARRLASV